jgi:transcriptional regulator NrdR family protein
MNYKCDYCGNSDYKDLGIRHENYPMAMYMEFECNECGMRFTRWKDLFIKYLRGNK